MSDSQKWNSPGTELKEKFPRLFQSKESEYGPSIGFPVGWTSLIQELFEAINSLLNDDQARLFVIAQIKEKYGGLRFYYSAGRGQAIFNADIAIPGVGVVRMKKKAPRTDKFPSEDVDRLIAEAEKKSEATCYVCGLPGLMRDDGWIHVTCDACEAKRRQPTKP